MSGPGDSFVELAVGHSADQRGSSSPSRTDLGRSGVALGGTVTSAVPAKPGAKTTPGLFSARKVVGGIRRYWMVALPAAVLAAVGAYGLVNMVFGPPAYTVRTQLHVAQNRPMILYDTPEGRTDFSTYQRGQIAMLRSRRVLQHAIDNLGDKHLTLIETNPDPVGWLETALQADFTLAPEHLRITLKGVHPEELTLILNTVRESYLAICVNTEQTTRKERLTELTGLREQHVKLRDERLTEMCDLAEKATRTRDPAMVKAARDDAYLMKQQLVIHLRSVQVSVKQAKMVPASPTASRTEAPGVQETVPDSLQEAYDRDPTLATESAKLTAIDDYLNNRRTTLVRYEQDDGYVAKLAERAQVEKRIEERKQAISRVPRAILKAPDAPGPIAPGGADGRERIQQMEGYAAELEKQIREEGATAERLTQSLLKIEAIREEATREDARVKALTERIEALEVEQKAPERTTLLEEAVVSQAPNPDKQSKIALGVAGGAFAAVFLAAGLLSALRNRVESPADVAAITRVVGVIPHVSQKARASLAPPAAAGDLDQFHRLGDAVDTTRCLVLPKSGPKGYVLLVTSAAAGEGKTTVSGHLAGRLARCGYRTLLVDANVRQPGTAVYLPDGSTTGYSDVLCGLANLDEAVISGPVPGLDLLTAGGVDAYTVNEHLDRHLPSLLAELRIRYDVVVMDGPPVLAAPEGGIIARWVNSVLMTARANTSRVSDLSAAVERMKAVNATVSGVVLSGVGGGSQSL